MFSKLYYPMLTCIMLILSGCSDHNGSELTFVEMQVTASQNPIATGFQTQLTSASFYSDGSVHYPSTTWESSDENFATVSQYGLVSALAPIEAVTITSTSSEGSGSITLTITDATITAIDLTPVNTELPVGLNVTYEAMGSFSDGSQHSLIGQPNLIWDIGSSEIATINQETGTTDTLSEGTTSITAVIAANEEAMQNEVRSNEATLTVTPEILQTIVISPDRVTWPLGLTQEFTAEGILSDGTTIVITDDVTWSSDTEGVLEQVENEHGLFKAIEVGNSNVSASYNELVSDNQAAFVVEHMEITQFTVESGTETQPIGKEVQFNAIAEFTDGNAYNVSGYKQVHWQSSAPEIATVTLSGVVKGVTEGDVTITAMTTYDGIVADKKITITPVELETIVVKSSDGNSILSESNTQQYEAVAMFTDGSTDKEIGSDSDLTWGVYTGLEDNQLIGSSDLQIPNATIDEFGLLTYVEKGEAPGSARIYTTFKGVDYQATSLLLPIASSLLLSNSNINKEFVGSLTQAEADFLKVKYSDVQGEYIGNYLYYVLMSQSEADNYCAQVLYDGHDDWRLPTSEELVDLWTQLDGDAEDLQLFDEGWVFIHNYWTMSSSEEGHNVVALSNGIVTSESDESLQYVTCVRETNL